MHRRNLLIAVVAAALVAGFQSEAEAARVLVRSKVLTNQGRIDLYTDTVYRHWVMYYSKIPGVSNPGARARNCYSLDELRDMIRRNNNNGWTLDMYRSRAHR